MFIKPKRNVSKVFIHCSAADNEWYGQDLKDKVYTWHVIDNKWVDIGYHFLIDKAGTRISARSLEDTPSAQKGYNTGSIAIMVHGLKDFTIESIEELIKLCDEINEEYDGDIEFWEHREVDPNKTCPVFSVKTVLQLDKNRHKR